LKPYPGHYFTGDGGIRDQDGYYWVTGRVDGSLFSLRTGLSSIDVLNVSGHRIGSAEVESALVAYPSVAEAAVVGIPHDIKGTAIFAYVILRAGASSENIEITLMNYVKEHVGSFAKPEEILIVHGVPKTRSGKIMRRILRKIASREFDVKNLGDITTLAEPAVVDELIAQMKELK
jgi:acetyl-CoA synthetase